MRKEYDFSKGVRNRYASKLPRRPRWPVEEEDLPLTAAQRRELDRRSKDALDRGRYLLVSQIGDRFALYYDVSNDAYVANDPRYATLFKREKTARAVQRLVSPNVRIVRCRVNSRGRLVLSSVPLRMPPRSR